MTAPHQARSERGRQASPDPADHASTPICAWCFEPLGDVAKELNGGIGHPACAEYVWHAIAGPDAVPWRPRRFYREDPLIDFCWRLGREAIKVGIDQHRLAIAIRRASNG